MKVTIFLCAIVVVAVSARPEDKYTDKWDNINVDEILSNKKVLVPFIKCGLDQGKCSPEGRELKSHIKEALESYCAKCTGPQNRGSRKVIGHLINNEPEYWKQLSTKYDPSGKYSSKYESELRTISV